MKVYILEQGCYDSLHVVGVFSSIERAMEASPVRLPKQSTIVDWLAYKDGTGPHPSTIEREGGWQKTDDDTWSNGLDWDDAASITEVELDKT